MRGFPPLWAFFLLSLSALALFSYGSLPPGAAWAVGLAWLSLFLFLRPFRPSRTGDPLIPGSPLSPRTLALLFVAFWILLLWTRSFRLGEAPAWPIMDEGRKGFFAMELFGRWDDRILWGESQIEPLYLWGLAAFFHVVPPSLESLRLYPALLSVLLVLTGYAAARTYWSRGGALLAAGLLAFTFWPFTFSRLCMRAGALPILECAALGLWFAWERREKEAGGLFLASILGLACGLGFYTYTAWPIVAVFFALAVATRILEKPRKWPDGVVFLLLCVPTSLPWLGARLGSGGLGYPLSLLSPADLFPSFCRYIAGCFAMGFHSAPFGPIWGGFLNPILGALVLVGLGGALTTGSLRSRSLWIGGFVLALLPGALTAGVEMHRVTPLLPWFLILIVRGTEMLARGLPRRGVLALGLLLGAGSFFLDAYHFFGPYQERERLAPANRQWRSQERERAFQVLRSVAQERGPGWILTDFMTDYVDQTLTVATFPIDALRQEGGSSSVRWAAILVNSNYEPFLKERFPGSSWRWLASDIPTRNGGMVLGLLPLDHRTGPILERWRSAHRQASRLVSRMMNLGPDASFEALREEWEGARPEFQGDPFLESVYWEKMGLLDARGFRYEAVIRDCQEGLRLGYPSANLYNQLGVVLRLEGRIPEARRAFQKALRCPVNRTPADSYLRQMGPSSDGE